MDENYLDNLLNEISLDNEVDNKIEDELDSQMLEEKRRKQAEGQMSQEEAFDMRLAQETVQMEDPLDLHFSEEQMEELDDLDNLADLDIGDLDFADIDFDDLDVTKLDDFDDAGFDDVLKDFEGDLEVDDFFDRGDAKKSVEPKESVGMTEEEASLEEEHFSEELNEDSFDANEFLDSLLNESEMEAADKQPIENIEESVSEEEKPVEENAKEETEDSLDDLLDTLADEEPVKDSDSSTSDEQEEELDLNDFLDFEENGQTGEEAAPKKEEEQDLSGKEADDLDDLLSMLDLDEESGAGSAETGLENAVPQAANDAIPDELNDMDELEEKPAKKKRTFMEILFGDPDEEDELSQEELEAIEAKKAEKKAAKEAKKEAAKAAKEEKAQTAKDKKALDDQKKKAAAEEKGRLKAEKKAKRRAEEEAEAAKNGPEKKLNRPAVIFIFTLFLGGLAVFYVGANDFNYKQAIEKATNYFAKQRYHYAYDEIVGVDVKEEDQTLKDRIYTVMYVERLYEAYNNNIVMGYEEKALDSLLRGVTKYYEYYDEAVELGIVTDLDYSFNQISSVLQSRYGISIEQAVAINKMENVEYLQTVRSYVAGADTSAGLEGIDGQQDVEGADAEDSQEDAGQPSSEIVSEAGQEE